MKNNEREVRLLKNVDALIVHSEKMKEAIKKRLGCNTPQVVLNLFDYLTPYSEKKSIETEQIELVYAGNLVKSGFISQLDKIKQHPGFKISFMAFLSQTIDV